MAREPRPFTITLTPQEASELLAPSGEGGHQQLHDRIRSQLANGNLTVELTDAELGRLVRYMTQYGSGGFQGRLRRAFYRPLSDMLSAG
jgi:hypothetical protein